MHEIPHLPQPGEVIAGRYRVERLLGKGGMGAVFVCHHELLRQRVAIKMLLGSATQGGSVERFIREAQAAARIEHERVVRIHDVATLPNGTPYMVMEFLEGEDLEALLLRQGPLPVEGAVDYVMEVLEAVARAHANGVVHRDLKPANVFLAKRSKGNPIIKVLDFGISKIVTGDAQAHALTKTQAPMGSPFYMSPEQLRNPKKVGHETDLWSIGVILNELLTGRVPYHGETLPEVVAQILEAPPPSMIETRADVPVGLEAVVQRCLAKSPQDRFGSALELARALCAYGSPRARASLQRMEEAAGGSMPPPRIEVSQPFVQSTGEVMRAGRSSLQSTSSGQAWGTTATSRSPSPWLIAGLVAIPILAVLLGVSVFAFRHHRGAAAPGPSPFPPPVSAAPSASLTPSAPSSAPPAVSALAPSAEPVASGAPSISPKPSASHQRPRARSPDARDPASPTKPKKYDPLSDESGRYR